MSFDSKISECLYPPIPEGFLGGRIFEITSESLCFESNDQKKWIKLGHGFNHNIKYGDLVAISDLVLKQKEMTLKSQTEFILLASNSIGVEKLNEIQNKLELNKKWFQFLKHVRNFFEENDFIQVKSPTLVPCPGTEPFLDPFTTEYKMGSFTKKYYLPTSPELHLKKMLSFGYNKIFEITPCFRNGESGPTHSPEFTMIEWYRSYDNLNSIKTDVMGLVDYLIKKLQFSHVEYKTKSVSQLFKEKCNFDLSPMTTRQDLVVLTQQLGLDISKDPAIVDYSWDDLFFLIFLEKIESQLGILPLFVEKYPPSQAALARLTEDGWGDRFEFYWKGLEIANAFHELNDPKIQMLRFEEDLEKKRALGKEIVDLDQEFLDCLKMGMPPSGGIALGLERLFMALYDLKEIKQFKFW